RLDLVGAHLIRQTIAAQYYGVVVAKRQSIDHNVDVWRCAQRLQYHVSIAVTLGLFGSYVAGFNELPDQRLIASYLFDRVAANHVGTAVSNLAKEGGTTRQAERSERGAHP